ncbi:hypothetical protein OG563_30495 [Nocardia vinacea]|uniref:Uncharacterized protein n=1 Tax=Nocardia vinacea TaxID=96468 RepID=A0ABZ1YNH5_9NOCA|nr:hypothetical protein [Nocardia vinacea]
MARIRNRNNDHNEEGPDEGRDRNDPKSQGEKFADEVEDFLASVAEMIDNPAPRPNSAAEPVRPTLRLVTTDDTAIPEAVTDPTAITKAGRAARRRMIRGSVGGSSVVVGLAWFAGWGQPWLVAGPIAAYSTGWLAYLWWNAALRPSIPQVLGSAASGIGHAVAAVFTAIAALVHGLIDHIDTAHTRHEDNRTGPATR